MTRLGVCAALRLTTVITDILAFDDELSTAAERHGISLVNA